MMSDKQEKAWNLLCSLDGETAARLLTDWHGLQLLDDGFYGFLIDEGYIEEPPEEDDEDEDAEYEAELERERQAAIREKEFTDFCASFENCDGCPFEDADGDCEELFSAWVESAKSKAAQ